MSTTLVWREILRLAPKEVHSTPAANLVAQGSQFSGGGWLGVATDLNRSARHNGVPISEVSAGGPADQAGIQPGDIILSIANRYLYTVDELSAAIKQLEPASRVLSGINAEPLSSTPTLSWVDSPLPPSLNIRYNY